MTLYLLTGSNQGDRLWYLARAVEQLTLYAGKIERASAVYETAAWGNTEQPAFLNQALMVSTSRSAHKILAIVQQIENKLDRVRTTRWGERTLDIDILYYEQEIHTSELLTVPHPQLHLRRFALVPLCEIAPDFIHPVLNLTQTELLYNCTDPLNVVKLQ